jgi:predicted TIM-barrel fold metal-dependent hydrolase
VAVAFPALRILLTHLGTLWHHEAFMVVEKNPNVFIDTAAYVYEIRELLTLETVQRVGPDRFVFGTDYPMPYVGHVHCMKDFVEAVEGLDLPPAMREAMFCQNVQHLLTGRPRREGGMSLDEMLRRAAETPRDTEAP